LMHGRQHMEYRLALVVHDKEDLKFKIVQIVEGNLVVKGSYWGKVDEDKEEDLNRLLGDEVLSVWIKDGSYEKIADAWVQGLDFDFSELPQSKYGRKISLPTYPFHKRSYWIGTDSGSGKKSEKLTLDTPSAAEDSLYNEVKNILSEIFKIPARDIEDSKNFARYGMDSLSGMRFINKIQEKFNVSLSVRVLLKCPSVERFCKLLTEELQKRPTAKAVAPDNKQEEANNDLTLLLQKLYSGEVSAQEALDSMV
jgi:acyl carrier protein